MGTVPIASMPGVMKMDKKALLSLGGLEVWYIEEKSVLRDFSMELFPNEVCGLIGLNGAGKTTLIKTLAGLLDTYRVETVFWEGGAFTFRDRSFKEKRYIVFAEDRSFGFFTFREYFSYVMGSYGKSAAMDELVKGFHFEEYTDVLLKELSTGNRKKAYLITAFALKPQLLLLDEPVNGLDFQSTEYLYKLINEYREYGTVLFSSHILESITLTADRVLVLEQGRISNLFTGSAINAGTIREVLGE